MTNHYVYHIELNSGAGWHRANLTQSIHDQERAVTLCNTMGKPGQHIDYRVKNDRGEIVSQTIPRYND